MGILGRSIFREIVTSALLGTVLFTFVLFLQPAGKLFELLVRSSAGLGTIAHLFALILPSTLTMTLPVGALVGILIGLSRMSADGEIIGMRAAGVPSRRVVAPVVWFALVFLAITAACALWLTPLAVRQSYSVLNRLAAEQLTAEIQPRVFQEQFPNTILYVGDVVTGPVERWRNMFLAEIRPPGASGRDPSAGPPITLAREAIAMPDVKNNRIQLHMLDVSTHEPGSDPKEYVSTKFPQGDRVLQASRPAAQAARPFSAMDTGPLWRAARGSRDAAIELHQRLARPFACLLLALIGIPLGVSSRKSGKGAAFVMTVLVAFLYYMGQISLIRMALQGALPVWLAVWTPNLVFAAVGLVLLSRLEKPGDRDIAGLLTRSIRAAWRPLRGVFTAAPAAVRNGSVRSGRLPLLPQILDTYILSTFLFYFFLLLVTFVLMMHVYTFFELLGDIIRNRTPLSRVFTYLFFLTPKVIYESAPIGVLVAVLVTFGVMAKSNEVTAFKAGGVSLYRLALPVILTSLLLSAGLFAFDYQIVPDANRTQDAIRNEIKGRAPQTYLRPDRKWIYGQGPRIYFYRYFDHAASVMAGVSVYELDLAAFQLKRHISAERAYWSTGLKTWVFENGWHRDTNSAGSRFEVFQAATFPELDEPPGYFRKEVIQEQQMNFLQLRTYIEELRQGGFDTVHLGVELHKKFSVPLFAFIMALISVPFAFLTGSRGAMAGVGASFGIAVAYWAVGQLFEQIGNINQLPAPLAAWSPDALFSLAALYLMTRMRT